MMLRIPLVLLVVIMFSTFFYLVLLLVRSVTHSKVLSLNRISHGVDAVPPVTSVLFAIGTCGGVLAPA